MSCFSIIHALNGIVSIFGFNYFAVNQTTLFLLMHSRNSKLELELAQVRADFERLKSQDNTKSERLEELS